MGDSESSGRFRSVFRKCPTIFVLCISTEVDVDANTDGYTQWFYFAVRGGSLGSKVTFRLVNMAKSGSLFGTLIQLEQKITLAKGTKKATNQQK